MMQGGVQLALVVLATVMLAEANMPTCDNPFSPYGKPWPSSNLFNCSLDGQSNWLCCLSPPANFPPTNDRNVTCGDRIVLAFQWLNAPADAVLFSGVTLDRGYREDGCPDEGARSETKNFVLPDENLLQVQLWCQRWVAANKTCSQDCNLQLQSAELAVSWCYSSCCSQRRWM